MKLLQAQNECDSMNFSKKQSKHGLPTYYDESPILYLNRRKPVWDGETVFIFTFQIKEICLFCLPIYAMCIMYRYSFLKFSVIQNI